MDYTQPDKPKEAAKSSEAKDADKYKAVAEQLCAEHKAGEDHVRPWRQAKRDYLKLYINQRKNPKKVGDTLMFSTHQTVLASLYKDRLDAEWMMREEEDEERVDAVNALWEFDYDEMGKAEHDFGKYFDATGYGIAWEDWSHFDRDTLTPIPSLWDPLGVVFDSKATSVNGNRMGEGGMRFVYRDVARTMDYMNAHGGYFNLDKLESDEDASSELRKSQEARDDARNVQTQAHDLTTNRKYPLIQGYTWIDGSRYLVEAGNGGKTIVRLQKLWTDYFPLEISRIYPDPHVLLTPGCWDFTEDKQRARAIMQNYTLDAAKFDVLPEWLFDKNKIKNKQQLREHKAGKWIEAEGLDANTIIPLQKPTIHQFSQGIMQELETNAQKALATPEIQQGIMFAQKRSATEIAEASANVDTRYELTARLFGIAESNAAYMWYDQYKHNFKKGIDKKTIRLVGAFGPKAMPITADSFNFKTDPDVKIESRIVSQAKKREQRNQMAAYSQVLVATPGANIRGFAKDMGRLFFPKTQVDKYLPPTLDEMRAEDENELLSENKLSGVIDGVKMNVEIEPTDDHRVHLEVHGKAADTKAKFAHIEAHKRAMMIQRNSPELFAGIQIGEVPPGAPQGMPGVQPPPPTPQGQVQELIT